MAVTDRAAPIPLGYIAEGDYDGSGNLIYWGLAKPGTSTATPAWQIRRLDYSGTGNLLDMLYANGSRNFDRAWTGRTGFSYS